MKKYTIEIKWALILVIVTILWMYFEKQAGLHSENISQQPIYTNFIAIPVFIIYILAIFEKRKKYYNGEMSYREGFKCGAIITLIITVLSPLTQNIIYQTISPEYFTNAIQYAVTSGKLKQAEAVEYFSLNNYILQGLIGTLVLGLLSTTVVSNYIKKS